VCAVMKLWIEMFDEICLKKYFCQNIFNSFTVISNSKIMTLLSCIFIHLEVPKRPPLLEEEVDLPKIPPPVELLPVDDEDPPKVLPLLPFVASFMASPTKKHG
jgi:hypothetical protein